LNLSPLRSGRIQQGFKINIRYTGFTHGNGECMTELRTAIGESEWAEGGSPLCGLEPNVAGTIETCNISRSLGHVNGRGTDMVDAIIHSKG
jgi:hypothetical protein